jgi:hypothetical protein
MQVSRDDAERSGLRVGAGLYVGSGSIRCGDRVLLLVLQTSAFLATPAAYVCSEFRQGIQLSARQGERRTSAARAGASILELMLVIVNPPAAKNTAIRGPVGRSDPNAQIRRRSVSAIHRGEPWTAPGGLCEVTKRLPHNGRQYRHRIKSVREEHERTAEESQLSAV